MKHRSKVKIDYHYVPAHKTNVARTIAAERKRLADAAATQAAQDAANAAEAEAKVAMIGKARGPRRMAGYMDAEGWFAIIIIACIIIGSIAFSAMRCDSRWESSGLKSKWGIVQGCLVQMPDVRWIPDDRVRDIDIAPKGVGR